MELTRRDFVKGAGTGAVVVAATGVETPAEAYSPRLKTTGTARVNSICYYCAVGCGIVASVADGKVTAIEGDREHPINRGALCSKAQAYLQVLDHPQRLTKVLYRAPGAADWQEKSLDWAMTEIAQRIKTTRDATFRETEEGVTVNRTEGLAALGSAVIANEECYLLTKLMRGLGVVWLEHQARI
ncbi:MAG: hypothetical protein A2050_01845 [Candidatus Rokubacteria bacterium GWA2_73_35]|nr:MAG: hypothetical protein A2050_01845 [Candidatus Rokubacteria bacterium GWA2_73_35]